MGNCLGNDEVEEPLCSGGESDIQGTETSSGNLGHYNPASGTPANLEASNKEENGYKIINGNS